VINHDGIPDANSAGVFQAYYMTNQLKDESADRIAWIASLQSFLMFASGTIGGPLFDRFGAKVSDHALTGRLYLLFSLRYTHSLACINGLLFAR
jgi:MFS family permease